ncbi:hypothetical protein H311_01365 [Anncaliia algerae PRA109]|nr:hypothetical protein H311_01365 [Anncaliia algerae PRA109]
MDDIVIISAKRTAICKAGKGSFRDVTLDKILYTSIKGCLESVNLEAKYIEECVFGNVLSDFRGTIEARAASLSVVLDNMIDPLFRKGSPLIII